MKHPIAKEKVQSYVSINIVNSVCFQFNIFLEHENIYLSPRNI